MVLVLPDFFFLLVVVGEEEEERDVFLPDLFSRPSLIGERDLARLWEALDRVESSESCPSPSLADCCCRNSWSNLFRVSSPGPSDSGAAVAVVGVGFWAGAGVVVAVLAGVGVAFIGAGAGVLLVNTFGAGAGVLLVNTFGAGAGAGISVAVTELSLGLECSDQMPVVSLASVSVCVVETPCMESPSSLGGGKVMEDTWPGGVRLFRTLLPLSLS